MQIENFVEEEGSTNGRLAHLSRLNFDTVFENHRKSLVLRATFTKVYQKCRKCSILASFQKPEAYGQTVLPDRSVLIGQKLVENAKMPKIQMRYFE